MRLIITGVFLSTILAGVVLGVELGAVSTADNVRFEIQALDSAGLPVSPDSGHVLVWFEGESSADASSYTGRWTNAGAGSAYVDSLRFAGHTYYYFVDQVGDIDNDEGTGLYTGAVILYADGGLPTPNRFSFTLGGDELSDYLARLDNLDEPVSGIDDNPWDNANRQLTSLDEDNTTIDLDRSVVVAADTNCSGQDLAVMPGHWTAADSVAHQGAAAGLDSADVARAVWNAPAANHNLTGTFGANLDAPVSAVAGGSGAYSITIVAYDTSNSLAVPGTALAVRNLDQTALLASAVTNASGRATVNLDAGSYLITATAPGFMFDAYDSIAVTGAESDTVAGSWFDSGTPASPALCRVFGYLFAADGRAETGARITASLPGGVTRMSGLIISPSPVTTTVNEYGYFYFDLIPSQLLSGSPSYEITINRSDGTILRKRVSVPDASNWQLSW